MFSVSVRKAVLCLLLIYHGALAEDKPCTVRDKGKYYDLNPLKASKDYEVKTSTNQSMWLNVCQNVKTDLFGIKDDSIDAGDVGGFIRRGHGDFIMGKMNTVLSVFDSRPRFVMSQGSRCKPKAGDQTTDIRASSMVEFVCDASVYGAGSPRLLAQLPPGEDETGCAYVVEWRTQYACPTSESGGVWGLFAILAVIFLVLLMTYTVLGTLYNRFVLQLRGFDQIPQFSIESMKYHGQEAWDWIKDMTTALDIGGSGRRRQGQHYNDISSGGSGFSFRRDEEHETGHDSNNGGFGGSANFVRPQPGRHRSAAFQRADMNPVSHQSQVNAERSLSFSSSTSPSPPTPIQSPPQPHPDDSPGHVAGPSKDGPNEKFKDFKLGDDDEDAQELGEVHVAPPLGSTQTSNSSSQPASNVPGDVPTTTNTQASSAAVTRGRDLGGGKVTLL